MNLLEKTLASVLVISGLMLTTSCAAVSAMTEGEVVTPEQRALEIIVVGDGAGPDACSLNYDEVGAAAHPVSVIAEQGKAHVRIWNQDNKVVFEADSIAVPQESAGESEGQPEMLAADKAPGGYVRLGPGDYRVECSVGTAV